MFNDSMRRASKGLTILLIVFLSLPAPGQVGSTSDTDGLIVGFEDGELAGASQALQQSLQPFGGRIVDQIPEIAAVKVDVPPGTEQAASQSIGSLSGVRFVEGNGRYEMAGTPDDEYWDDQWGPKQIEADRAWDATKGSPDVIIAVLDSGLDYTHLDIVKNYLSTDSYDFIYDDNDPYPTGDGLERDRGVAHGTHVAGILGALSDNELGIAGLSQSSILGIRVLNDEGTGSYWQIAKGIVHAAKAEAKIINMSLSGAHDGKVVESAVNFADDHGVLVIAAAGNDAKEGINYPARYEATVAVSATDDNDELASFSSYGPNVDLAAPGVKILSTVPGNKYSSFSGTSMATPHVVGVAALIWSADPELTNDEVIQILCESADDLGPSGRDDKFGCGRLNAARAVQMARDERSGSRPGPTPSRDLTLAVDQGCGPEGVSYQIGDRIEISYASAQDATVKLYRVGYADSPQQLISQALTANVEQSSAFFRAEREGIETVVLQARTESGTVLTRACSYAIGNVSFDKVQIRIDKGCGATYQIGERITLTATAKENSELQLIDFATDGSVTEIVDERLSAGETLRIPAQVTGPIGQDTLVARAELASGLVVSDACSLTIDN